MIVVIIKNGFFKVGVFFVLDFVKVKLDKKIVDEEIFKIFE